jgi:tetratricopeptide (TPR) repeat protein
VLAGLHTKQATMLQTLSRVADAHAAAARAAAIAAASDAPEIEGMAQAQMGLASFYLHAFPSARAEALRAMELGQRLRSAELLAAGGCALGWVEAVSGELDTARQTLGRAAATAKAAALPAYGIVATAVEAQIDHWQGDYGRSLRRLRGETLPLMATTRRGEASAFVFPQLLALFSLGLPLAGKGAFGEAYATFAEGLALAERVGDEIFRMRFLNSLGHVLAECGDIDAARPLNEQSRDLARPRADSEVLANAELNLADGWLAQGDAALSREIGEAVLGVVKSPTTSDFMRWRYAQHLFASLGEARLAQGRLAPATACADQCLDLATRTRSLKYVARGWRLKAGILRARGDAEAAGEMLRRALLHARRARNPGQIWRSELALGAFLRETGKPDAANERFAAARRCLAGIQGRLEQQPALHRAFATSRLFEDALAEASAR